MAAHLPPTIRSGIRIKNGQKLSVARRVAVIAQKRDYGAGVAVIEQKRDYGVGGGAQTAVPERGAPRYDR